ncbi:hypothetical protein Hamer_G009754, partial [Homarus americanus]
MVVTSRMLAAHTNGYPVDAKARFWSTYYRSLKGKKGYINRRWRNAHFLPITDETSDNIPWKSNITMTSKHRRYQNRHHQSGDPSPCI